MRISIPLAVMALLMASPALSRGAAAPPPAVAAGYNTLVVNEEFRDNPGVLLQRWAMGLWYQKNVAPLVQFRDGISQFTIRENSKNRIFVFSSWGATDSIPQTFHFGYFEARMKWGATTGNWANFWLVSSIIAENPRAPVPGYCEIDINEAFDGFAQSTVHDWLTLGKETSFALDHVGRTFHLDSTVFHTFGLLWQPGRISFYLDGKLVNSMVSPKVCDEQAAILAFGAGRHNAATQQASFDWVRVWQ